MTISKFQVSGEIKPRPPTQPGCNSRFASPSSEELRMNCVCMHSCEKYDAYAPACGSDTLSYPAINTTSKMLKDSFRGCIWRTLGEEKDK